MKKLKLKKTKNKKQPLKERYIKENKPEEIRPINFVSSGSWMLDLALTNEIGKAYPIGRVVNVIGDFSTGKCIKDAYILTEDGMFLINDFVAAMHDKEIRPCFKTIASNNNKTAKTKLFYAEQVNKTNHIKTKGGFDIEGTDDHKIKIWDNCSFKMKKLSEINEGEFVVIQKGMNLFPKKEYLFSKKERKKKEKNKHDSNSINWNTPKNMCDSLASFLGYFVADGNFMPVSICISNKRQYIVDELKKIGNNIDVPFSGNRYFSRKEFRDFIFSICNEKEKFTARHKFVPNCILQSTKKHQALFLRCLIDCDGYLNNGNSLEYYTASSKLAKQVQLILLNFGIFSTNTTKWNEEYRWDYHTIRLITDDLLIYANEIGSLKYDFTNISSLKTMSVVPNLIPKIWDNIEKIRKEYGWRKNGYIANGDRFPKFKPTKRYGDASHNNIKNFIALFSDYTDTSSYEKLLNYHFEEIIKKEIKHEKTWVWDFTVPKNHLFWSNGMISHNTLCACEMVNAAWYINAKKEGKKVKIYYDEVESAFDLCLAKEFNMPLKEIIGLRERLPEWEKNKNDFTPSKKVEDFYNSIQKVIKESKNHDLIVYVLDSLDALTDAREITHIEKKGVEKQDFGGGKAKMMSQLFRTSIQDMANTNILLFIVSQIRTNFGVMFGPKFTRCGGKALDFYSSQTFWLLEKGKIEDKNKFNQGIEVEVKVTKNKVGGRYNNIKFNILHGYGIDNIGSAVEFLWETNCFEKSGAYLIWKDKKMFKSELIKKAVNEDNTENELKELLQNSWDELVEAASIKRKPKWG